MATILAGGVAPAIVKAQTLMRVRPTFDARQRIVINLGPGDQTTMVTWTGEPGVMRVNEFLASSLFVVPEGISMVYVSRPGGSGGTYYHPLVVEPGQLIKIRAGE